MIYSIYPRFHYFTLDPIKKNITQLTPSMEDYLEMIYRLFINIGFTRIHDLSSILHVRPPSVTRMVNKLTALGLINHEKYGVVRLTELGKLRGHILLKRHNIIEVFLKSLGVTESLLEETEKIEHTVSKETLICIADFLSFLEENPEILNKFQDFKSSRADT